MFDDVPHERPVARHGAGLGRVFFEREPAIVARDLIGRTLIARVDGEISGGTIVETEAYLGSRDPGSHAATRGITPRNRVMYGQPGTVYVYLSYGCHHLLNLVCCEEGIAGAVLIRAIEPREGITQMRHRRGRGMGLEQLCNGPGKLSAALGIDLTDNDTVLSEGRVSVYDGVRVPEGAIGVSGRVGLSAGHELELRYFLQGSKFVSRGRLGPPGGASRSSEGGRG